MEKATRDRVLPTTIIGSLPRLHRYTAQLGERRFRVAMGDAIFREQYVDAVSSLIRDQERAGRDIVTDGDSRFDSDVAGGSWSLYPARRLAGTAGWTCASTGRPGRSPTRSCETSPVVVARVGRGQLEYTPIWKTAQRMTARPVKFGTPSAEVIEGQLTNRFYADRKEVIMDVAEALNAELTELAQAGCQAVQIEAPWITRSAHRQRAEFCKMVRMVRGTNTVRRGLGCRRTPARPRTRRCCSPGRE